jgi:threonine synthase
MDIQFAYNLERMLYFICNEDPSAVRPYMQAVEQQYSYVPGALGAQLDCVILRRIQSIFSSCSVSDAETLETMAKAAAGECLYSQGSQGSQHEGALSGAGKEEEGRGGAEAKEQKKGVFLCPHSATAVFAATGPFREVTSPASITLCVLTAHPAKFEETVRRATGKDPVFPPAIDALRKMPQQFISLDKQHGNWRREWIDALKAAIICKQEVPGPGVP